jgi:hypothetical protein
VEASTQDRPVIPETAGLPPRRPAQPVVERPPTEAEAVDAAAQGTPVSRSMEEVLLDHFFGDEPAAGEGPEDRITLEIDTGAGQSMRVQLRSLDWSEWQEAQQNARRKDGSVDEFYLSSWVVAYTIIDSPLGRIVTRLQQEDKEHAPSDAAALLRRFFRKKSGSLMAASQKVLVLSNLNAATDAAREVEAGKD